jgi:hypothetical protein
MVLSLLSELGASVCVNSAEETFITALADGTAKAGWVVGLTAAGVIAGSDTDGVDEFVGIVMERYDTDLDTAVTAGKTVQVVLPRSGHRYRVIVTDLNSSIPGVPVGFGATAGALSVVATIESTHVARTWKYTDGDTIAELIWGGG